MPVTLCPSNNLDVLDTVTVASLLVILDENVSEETVRSNGEIPTDQQVAYLRGETNNIGEDNANTNS